MNPGRFIFNTDQGSQFTSEAFVGALEALGIRISMDGRNRALDNIFVEWFWRSLKYEDIYLKDYQTMEELKQGLKRYFGFYNSERFHQSLDYKTPDIVYDAYFTELEHGLLAVALNQGRLSTLFRLRLCLDRRARHTCDTLHEGKLRENYAKDVNSSHGVPFFALKSR